MSEIDKAYNKDPKIQEFLQFIREMTINYSAILSLNPDMFPTIQPEGTEQIINRGIPSELTAHRFVHLFEQSGYSVNFMKELH